MITSPSRYHEERNLQQCGIQTGTLKETTRLPKEIIEEIKLSKMKTILNVAGRMES